MLSTIGHHEENLPNSLSGDYTPMTDPNGNVCRGSFCPNDPRLHEYIAQVYQAIASIHPDYIWIDDDVRLFGHGPIAACCFCDACVALFSKRSGTSFTRESLRDAMGAGTLQERLQLRRAFLQHNRDTISALFKLIETTVHAGAPGLPLGFMTGDRFYEGYDFDTWAEVLTGPSQSPVLWRPVRRVPRISSTFPDKVRDGPPGGFLRTTVGASIGVESFCASASRKVFTPHRWKPPRTSPRAARARRSTSCRNTTAAGRIRAVGRG